MRRQFVECDDNGVVIDCMSSETKNNKGNGSKEPQTPIKTKKPSHKVRPCNAANKGDKWSDAHGLFLRPLTKQ
jgi:hypothetical protein